MKKMFSITNKYYKFRNDKKVLVGCEANGHFMFVTKGLDGNQIRFGFNLN